MRRGNYLYFCIAVGVLSLAIIQFFRSDLLPISIYGYIAWASLELTLLEIIKTTGNYLSVLKVRKTTITQEEIDLSEREANIFGKFDVLKDEAAASRRWQEKLISKMEEDAKRFKWVVFLERVIRMITVLQIALLFVKAAILFTVPAPDIISSSKTIGVLALLSFAFLLFSYFLTCMVDGMVTDDEDKRNIYRTTSNHYIDLLETVSKTRVGDEKNN